MERIPVLEVGPELRPKPGTEPTGFTHPPNELSSNYLLGSRVNDAASTGTLPDNEQHVAFILRPLLHDAKNDRLPDLKFMPLLLRTGWMCAAMTYNLVILALLFVLWYNPSFTFSHQWGYFAIQILPPVLGSITSSLMQTVLISLYRIMPFMLAAGPNGSTFKETILASYFPGLDLLSTIRTRNGLLLSGWIIDSLVAFILAFKSSLLNTDRYSDYVDVVVTEWAVLFLIAIYILTIVFSMVLTYKLHDRVTGLRWDPASVADHLTLFRHSDFLDKFEGTDIATRSSIEDRFRHKRIKLGYWKRGDEVWHGFGALPARDEQLTGPRNPSENDFEEQFELHSMRPTSGALFTQKYTSLEVSDTRYLSVSLNFEHWMAYIWVLITLGLFAAFSLGLIVGLVDGKPVPVSYGWAAVLFQFIPTVLIGFYNWFWHDIDLFARSTQPFRGMVDSQKASQTLLLDYNTLPPFVVTWSAILNGHHRVAWTSIIVIVQRILPILAAGSTTVIPEDQGVTIYASKVLFIIIAAWLGLYCILIPLEVFGWNAFRSYGNRHLPRCYDSISDLISWTYASKILRSSDGEPFDINMLEAKKTERWYMNARLVTKLDDTGKDVAQYSFGLYESVEHKGVFCMGFDVATNVTTVKRQSRWRKRDPKGAERSIVMHATKPRGLSHLLGEKSERQTNTQPLFEQTIPEQDQEA